MLYAQRWSLSLVLGLCSFSLFAQVEQAPGVRELRLLAWAPLDRSLILGVSAKTASFLLNTEQFMVFNNKQVPFGQTIDILTEVPDPKQTTAQGLSTGSAGVTGPKLKVLYASAPWPGSSRNAIGFLAPDGGSTTPKGKLVLLPDSPELHPEHSMRAINLTAATLAVRLGDKQAFVPSGGELICAFEPGRIRIDIAENKNGTWTSVIGSNLATARHYRCFVLIRPQVNPNPLMPVEGPDIHEIFEQTSLLPVHAPLPLPPTTYSQ